VRKVDPSMPCIFTTLPMHGRRLASLFNGTHYRTKQGAMPDGPGCLAEEKKKNSAGQGMLECNEISAN
jgi:hypothetical protein